MKFSPLWYVISSLVIIILLLILLQPAPKLETEKEQAYKYQIAILKGQLDSTNKAGKTIVQKFNTRVIKDSVSIKSKDREIKALEIKLAKQRTPRVDTLIRDNPDLASFVETQSEIIGELKEEVDTLKSQVKFHIQVNRDLIQNHEAAGNISKRIDEEKDNRIANLEKQVRKKARGNKLLKALAVGGFVGGLFLGGSL